MANKGGEFERKISKELSLWWSENERDDIFWRSQGSGARSTVRAKQGKSTYGQSGDITATDPIGSSLIEFVTIELKKGYNKWNTKELLDTNKKSNLLLDFIKQCEREKDEANVKHWLLITKQDRRNTLLFFSKGFVSFLRRNNYPIDDFDYIKVSCKNQMFYVIKLDEFFEKVDPQIFKN